VQAVGGAGCFMPERIGGQTWIVSFYCHGLPKKRTAPSRP